MSDVSLAELCIFACAQAFRSSTEQVATGIGPVPRIGAGLAKLTHSPGLMMTDGEAYLVEEPVPIGPPIAPPKLAYRNSGFGRPLRLLKNSLALNISWRLNQ